LTEDFPIFCTNEDEARRYLEEERWPAGPVCPHCKAARTVYRLRGGVSKCAGCRKKFTVRLGTVFEDSRIPLHKWLLAVHLICASKKGLNAAELQRALALRSYRSALFMAYRIEWALRQPPFAEELKGIHGYAAHR
jgi:transposase-like protein